MNKLDELRKLAEDQKFNEAHDALTELQIEAETLSPDQMNENVDGVLGLLMYVLIDDIDVRISRNIGRSIGSFQWVLDGYTLIKVALDTGMEVTCKPRESTSRYVNKNEYKVGTFTTPFYTIDEITEALAEKAEVDKQGEN